MDAGRAVRHTAADGERTDRRRRGEGVIVLIGIGLIVAGFALRLNPLAVVAAAAVATGLAAGLGLSGSIAALGHAFNEARYVTVVYLVLPAIGLLERYGLQVRAREAVARLGRLTVGRLLVAYLALRQVTAALGLISIAGQAQTVRPLLAPMAEAAGERQGGPPRDDRVRALAAATDNVGVFFGEDIFLAIGSILLMKGVLAGYGIVLEPFQLSVWAIPTAIAAFAIHGARLWRFDRRVRR